MSSDSVVESRKLGEKAVIGGITLLNSNKKIVEIVSHRAVDGSIETRIHVHRGLAQTVGEGSGVLWGN